MNKQITKLMMFVAVITVMSSCTSINKSMREPNSIVRFEKADFTLSEQVSAEATSTKILNIDWARLFMKKTGVVEGGYTSIVNIASIPVVGNLAVDRTSNYALYELMSANPGYDVVFYPQYETKVNRPIGLGFIYKVTTVKTTARLAKLK